MRKKCLFLCIGIIIFWSGGVSADTISWIDWQSTSVGSLTVGSEIVGVTMSGSPWDLVDGDANYNNSYTNYTSETGTYAGLQPSDVIRVSGVGGSANFILSFDTAIIDPYIALVSVGAHEAPVTYSFNSSFSVVSSGHNKWGYTGYSVDGNAFTGEEYNGILKFMGTYSSISFNITPDEHWHGFNFGVSDLAPIPEPTTMLLLGIGLIGLAGARRKME